MSAQNNKNPIVYVDPEIADLVPKFLDSLQQFMKDFKVALSVSDFDRVYHLAHQIAGAGDGYGFTEVTTIGRQLQIEAKSKNEKNISILLENLENYLNTVEIIYEPEEKSVNSNS